MTIPPDERRASDRIDVTDAQIGHRFGHFRRGGVRLCAFVLAMGVFFYAANAIDPGQTAAVGEEQQSGFAASQPQSLGSLGDLTSLEYTVEIHATIDGPRYTVRDADGAILGAMLEELEVEQVAPGLNVESMFSDPLMLAEPRDAFDR